MKLFTILSHPVLLLSIFPLILISGESFGGPYLLYLILALPHGGTHALLALAGVALILFSFAKYYHRGNFLIGPILNFAGLFCLIASLYNFFILDKAKYNYSTFEETVPILSFILFGFLALLFILDNIITLSGKRKNNN